MPDLRFDVLVLAGRRDENDELAAAAGATHRALLDIAGTPMLARVLTTLMAHDRIDLILLCSDAPELLQEVPAIAGMVSSGRVQLLPAAESPSRSVLAGIDSLTARDNNSKPLLVTTGDHALLDHGMLDFFLDASHDAAQAGNADVTLALVSETIIAKRFPDVARTYLPFRGERYSGANLFGFMNPDARKVAIFWRTAEEHRKQPWRMVSKFGFLSLVLFILRRLDLASAFERVSMAVGARVVAIEMPVAEAAVDVDKVSDWMLVNRVFDERAAAAANDTKT
ncbi:MAG: nucleotidyltransferase family protein [Myxococcota bacterium]|nr:nucleotidyltransferase family protein [Myxococcota bacterium]